jgi:hypothetical protein
MPVQTGRQNTHTVTHGHCLLNLRMLSGSAVMKYYGISIASLITAPCLKVVFSEMDLHPLEPRHEYLRMNLRALGHFS